MGIFSEHVHSDQNPNTGRSDMYLRSPIPIDGIRRSPLSRVNAAVKLQPEIVGKKKTRKISLRKFLYSPALYIV